MQPFPKSAFPPFEAPEAHPVAPEVPTDASTASSPNIETLLERFNEPLGAESLRAPAAAAKPAAAQAAAAPAPRLAPPRQDSHGTRALAPARSVSPARFAPPAPNRSNLSLGGLVAALTGIALVPMSFLFFLWWQDGAPSQGVLELSIASAPVSPEAAQPKKSASVLDVGLSAPGRIDADEGEATAFPIAIEAKTALPARSIVAVSGLPQGATFSQGRPYGDTGWSLRPDEIGDLQLRLPPQSSFSDLNLELISGDGTVLAQSATQLSVTPPQVATASALEDASGDTIAQAARSATGSIESAPAKETASTELSTELKGPVTATTQTAQAPSEAAATEADASAPDVKVNTVKTVAVAPPHDAKPYNGAMALGSPADAPQAAEEWMETKTAVDMHAEAQQFSETVKIAQGGLKLRVTGRDKNWVQVTDPKSGTTGWIYNRFLKEAEAPAQ